MIYFDNAATTGNKPQNVIKAVTVALKEYSANPGRSGHATSVKTSDAIYRVRESIADFFGASGPEKVIFTLNCTHSINCVLKGILKPGDHVIVSSFEHNAVMRPLKKIGIPFDIADVSLLNDEETLNNFKRKIKPNTRMIICTGASNVFGKLLPIEEIGKICYERGILFALDAAQIAGVIPIDMQKMHIDFLCVAPHKGLYAPMGIGILIAEKYIENTVLEGGTGTNSIELTQPEYLPERHESGTVNVSGIMGIGAGIEFVKNIGIDKLYNHEMQLTRNLYFGLKSNGNVKLYTPEPLKWSYAPVLSFNFYGNDSIKTAEILSKNGIAVRGGLHCAPLAHRYLNTLDTGTVRLSTAGFNTVMEVNSFLKLIKDENFVKKLKKPIE